MSDDAHEERLQVRRDRYRQQMSDDAHKERLQTFSTEEGAKVRQARLQIRREHAQLARVQVSTPETDQFARV